MIPKKTYTLEINTTQKCNLNCSYCFEKDKINEANKSEKSSIINIDEVLKFLHNIFSKSSNNNNFYKTHYNHLNISLWGGEPTLNLTGIFNLINTIESKYNNENISYSMYSNGKNINSIIKIIHHINELQRDIHIQISYDGLLSTDRVDFNNNNSNNIVLNNIKTLLNKNYDISLKSTLSMKDLYKIDLIYEEFLELQKEYPNNNLSYSPSIDYINIPKGIDIVLLKDKFISILKKDYKFYKNYGYFVFNWFSKNKLSDDIIRHTICSAGMDMHCINGSEHLMCHGAIYTKDKELLNSDIKTNYIKFREDINLNIDIVCNECIATTCYTCPAINLDINKNYYHNNKTDLCKVYQLFGIIDRKMNSLIYKKDIHEDNIRTKNL